MAMSGIIAPSSSNGGGFSMSKFTVKLVCCGRDDGEFTADTWEEANQFRESYTSGAGVNEHGYAEAHQHESGHQRAGVIAEATEPSEAPELKSFNTVEGRMANSQKPATEPSETKNIDNSLGQSPIIATSANPIPEATLDTVELREKRYD